MKQKSLWIAAIGTSACIVAASLHERRYLSSLHGKVVIVTGSSRGLGLALAEEFARHGTRLVLTARDPYELDRAKQQLIRNNASLGEDTVISIPCDLTEEDQTRAMIAAATKHYGNIDILVNNAGVISVGPVEDQSLAAFKEAISVNYYGALHSALAVLPQMLARGHGSIVNIASIGGKIAVPHLLPYSASKFALVGFSQGLNAEVRSKGVRVTTVCPGLMRTGSHIQAQFTGDREKEYRWFSLGASLPGISASARGAARKIVRATAAGRSEITITPQAFVAAKFAQLAPGLTSAVLGVVNSVMLPEAVSGASEQVRGSHVDRGELRTLTAFGDSATYDFNQR